MSVTIVRHIAGNSLSPGCLARRTCEAIPAGRITRPAPTFCAWQFPSEDGELICITDAEPAYKEKVVVMLEHACTKEAAKNVQLLNGLEHQVGRLKDGNVGLMETSLLEVLREGKRNLMEYKDTWHTQHVVIPALEEYEREQIANGLVEKD
ncbi:hypothetical protein BAUCODRAFT_331794 [Baudoinia panamericana UAMH 10762]|uniref:Uncharacterized protein n=1 Tax=Baudoinia panamericana (strain UAMH 10762) TaxID=717646 RepID=M2MWH0_BAUPA|nr:uncharacterized protein BAUCODRAFT_331794 [Baudoinia panamericana UAMH 10762]EMC90929.1 hypothetical protein BAUCODRAFT_331794 [Baudoinia panamericana UAMH 10762]